MKGLIFDIKRMSIDDGPGFRTVIFLKGCPLSCIWCHSPESMGKKPELVFYEHRCWKCGSCCSACKNKVHSIQKNGIRRVLFQNCVACGQCVEACYFGALEIKGKEVDPDFVLKEVTKDIVFYNVSSGGVTFSGGESLFQPQFIESCLNLCKNAGIHTALDTSGYVDPEILMKIIPLVDLFLYDLKHCDSKTHEKLTGVPNDIILANLNMVAEAGKDITLSIPVIPGINSMVENIHSIAELVSKLKIRKIRFLHFNRLSGSKYKWMGLEYPLESLSQLGNEWNSKVCEIIKKRNPDLEITFH